MANGFHLLDWLVLAAFAAGLIGIVVWVARMKEESHTDYFLAGRDASWISIGSSIFASNIGSEHLVGLAGAGFVSGMAMAHWEMHAWIILLLGWVFVPFYDRIKVFTMPEFLERRFSSGSRTLLSLISLISYVLTKVAVTVYSGGVVFGTVFGITSIKIFGMNLDMFWVSAIGLVLITGIYTVAGGMKAIMYTSVLQTPVLLIGSIVILVVGLIKVGGWGEVHRLVGDNIHLVRAANDTDFPWTGVFLGSAIIGFWYWCTDQYIVQRVLSGRNQKEARRGAILAGYFKLLPVFIFLIPGMIAYAMNKKGLLTVADPDRAFSSLVAQLLPIGFKGVVVCGLLAALMSSLASLFNSSAALFVGDFYKKLKPQSTEKHLVKVGRIATATVVVLGIVWIPVMKGIGKVLYAYLQDVQSLLGPAIASAFILGVFWKRANAKGGFAGLAIGFALGMFRLLLNVTIGVKAAAVNTVEKLIQALQKGNSDLISTHSQSLAEILTTKSKLFAGQAGESIHQNLTSIQQSLGGNPDVQQTLTGLTQAKAGLIALFTQQHGLLYKLAAINWLHFCIALFFLCLITTVVVSLATPKPEPEQLRYTRAAATAEEKKLVRASWNRWDVIHTIIILSVIVAFYIYFW
ncbi:MAG: Na+/glucose cotransporter [Calditrichaeota bacterium]|nr:MAG: Na+/glucose cotransporter [Calditrichota bacterium]